MKIFPITKNLLLEKKIILKKNFSQKKYLLKNFSKKNKNWKRFSIQKKITVRKKSLRKNYPLKTHIQEKFRKKKLRVETKKKKLGMTDGQTKRSHIFKCDRNAQKKHPADTKWKIVMRFWMVSSFHTLNNLHKLHTLYY